MNLVDCLRSTHREVIQYEERIKSMYSLFLLKSKCLEESSGHNFELQRYWPITRVNLKGWILESDLCKLLEKNEVIDYSVYELKEYFNNYQKKTCIDCANYLDAIDVYLLMNDLEELIDEKVEKEMTAIWYVDEEIKKIEDVSKKAGTQNVDERHEIMILSTVLRDTSLFEPLYTLILERIEKKRKDLVIDDECYKYCIIFLNDVFDFFIRYGEYIQTPENYLYENE